MTVVGPRTRQSRAMDDVLHARRDAHVAVDPPHRIGRDLGLRAADVGLAEERPRLRLLRSMTSMS